MPDDLPELIGTAPAFLDLLAQVSAAAPLDRPLLVVGERGVGKELIAARLHFLSRRWDQPLVKVNCAALAETLLESELFGHEAGAFTGAQRRHRGRFERADRGTLFLDEIAAASLRVQEQILRVIEYGEFERVGGSATLRCDVRVIAAANVDLPALAATGRFRADLLDRLAFDVLTVPPLRARAADIRPLALHFGAAMAREQGAVFAGFAPAALATLEAHRWPGNLRELRNVVERAVHRHLAAGGAGRPVETIVLDPFASPFRPPPARSLPGPPEAAPAPGGPAAPPGPDSPLGWPLPAPDAVPARPQATPSAAAGATTADAAVPPWAAALPAPPPGPYDLAAYLAALERAHLAAALAAHGHRQRPAAAWLGLRYDQLRGLLRKHGLAGRSAPRPPAAALAPAAAAMLGDPQSRRSPTPRAARSRAGVAQGQSG